MNRSTRLALSTTAVLSIVPTSASAAPLAIQGGSVDWNQANVYNAAPERTFLGHTTNPGLVMQGKSNGTALTTAGATTLAPDGSVVDGVRPESARGVGQAFTFRFPAASGTFDREAKALDLSATGTLTYSQYPALQPTPPAPIVLTGLRITLQGTTGAVYTDAATTYPAGPLFTLNAAQAQFTSLGGGRYLVANLVPTLAKDDVFGTAGQYAPGTSGPDRTPNTWGGFSVVVDTQAPAAAPTPTPAPAERIVERVVEKTTVSRQVVIKRRLAKAPFSTGAALDISIRKSGRTAVLGEGYVVGKRLTVILPEGTALSGKYVLRRLSGAKRLAKTATVRFASTAAAKKGR